MLLKESLLGCPEIKAAVDPEELAKLKDKLLNK